MAYKQSIKRSEARILVYLSVVANTNKTVMRMSAKLDIGYKYIMELMPTMVEKGWITKDKYPMCTYYHITKQAPLIKAKEMISNGN